MNNPRCLKCDKRPAKPSLMNRFCGLKCAAGYGLMASSDHEWCAKHKLWFNDERCGHCAIEEVSPDLTK